MYKSICSCLCLSCEFKKTNFALATYTKKYFDCVTFVVGKSRKSFQYESFKRGIVNNYQIITVYYHLAGKVVIRLIPSFSHQFREKGFPCEPYARL